MLGKTGYLTTLAASLCLAMTAPSEADEYDYEIGVLYDQNRASSVSTFGIGAVPGPPIQPMTLASDTDNDTVGVSGTWYFDGVRTSGGPKSRAAFLSKASSLSVSYSRGFGDTTTIISPTGPGSPPPTVVLTDQDSNNFEAGLRYVWPTADWYGLANFSRIDAEIGDIAGAIDLTTNAYSLGVGKYLGSQTTVDLNVVRLESDAAGFVIGGNISSTEASINFSHIGDLLNSWQYGADFGILTTGVGDSAGSYRVGFSLYPTRALAMGLNVSGGLGGSRIATSYSFFLTWFLREQFGLTANYGFIDVDNPFNTDFDQDNIGLSAIFRF